MAKGKALKVSFSPPPMQKMLDYVVKKYSVLQEFCDVEGVEVDAAKCSDCHRRSYAPGGSPKYGCYNYRNVYLVRYLATQAAQTAYLIGEHILSLIEDQLSLSAISFGGGPGVEALALMDQLGNCEAEYELLFDNIDCEPSWEAIYQDLTQTFSKWVKNVRINPGFYQIDVMTGIQAHQYDVVFLSWVLSEIDVEYRPVILSNAHQLARANGYVLIIDRPEQDLFEGITDAIHRISGYTLIASSQKYEKNCGLDFPTSSKVFGPKYDCNTAYLVLSRA